MESKPALRCAFCTKVQADVRKLIAGPDEIYICDECVALCNEIIADGLDRVGDAPPPMGRLDASWRGDYIANATAAEEAGPVEGCVFCTIMASGGADDATHIVHQGDRVIVILNAYPYTSGHVMVMPRRHVANLGELTADEHTELWALVTHADSALRRAYRPEGMNIGANLGRAAGAGIPGHLHVHVVPRWNGDTNFMTSIAEVRVVPESLDVTWTRLRDAW